MPPQTSTISNQLDPQAVNLAKAIRQSESGGNFTAQGKSGEYGAYQWTEPTWQKMAASAGMNVPLKQATPEQQNEVAYKQIKTWKDRGYNVGQIASMWNAGEGKPNAYVDGNSGINNSGTAYDTSAYAKGVAETYQKLKNENQNNGLGNFTPKPQENPTENVTSEAQAPTKQAQDQNPGFLNNLTSGNFGGAIKDAGNFLFPIIGDVGGDLNGTNKKSVLQQGADLGLSALPFIPGLGEAGEAARGAEAAGEGGSLLSKFLGSSITKTAGLGAVGGALQGVSQGNDLGGTLKSAALGGATGGVLGGIGKGIGKLLDYLPQRMVSGVLKNANPDTIQYALEKGVGSPTKMLAESESSISGLGNSLGTALKHPQYNGVLATANDILPAMEKQFPNAGLDATAIGDKLMQIAPNQKTLIEKLVSGQGLTLDELHTLNSAVGKNTFKSVLDTPVTKAGKDIGSAFYHSASNFITQKAPETAPIIDSLSKEYPLRTALQKLMSRTQKSNTVSLEDILSTISGFNAGGPIGGAVGYGVEKFAKSPTTNLRIANVLNRVGNSSTVQKGGLLASFLASRGAGINQ